MAGFTIIGLGLNSESDLSLRGLEAARRAEEVYLESYTSLLPDLSLPHLEQLVEHPVKILARENLEHPGLTGFLREVALKNVALLVPGDPLTATTHQIIRLQALKEGFDVRVIHGSSILTASPGLAGLFVYKFGPSATITYPDNPSKTAYDVMAENKSRGLHTLFFLDIRSSESRYMLIPEALRILKEVEAKEKRGIVADDTIFVGVARAGSERPVVKAGTLSSLLDVDFAAPPHSLIAPGKLHFIEEEALALLRTGT